MKFLFLSIWGNNSRVQTHEHSLPDQQWSQTIYLFTQHNDKPGYLNEIWKKPKHKLHSSNKRANPCASELYLQEQHLYKMCPQTTQASQYIASLIHGNKPSKKAIITSTSHEQQSIHKTRTTQL